MNAQPIDYAIEIICDDSAHARDKVAKIDTFYREAGTSPGRWFAPSETAVMREDVVAQLDGGGRGEETHRFYDAPEWPSSLESVHRRHDDADDMRRSRSNYVCKLCGQSLPSNEGTLSRVLDLVASVGQSRTSINMLHLIASRRAD